MRRTTVAGPGALAGRMAGFTLALLALAGGAARGQESWDAVYIGQPPVKVGYINLRVQNVEDRGRPLLRVQFDQVLDLKRGNDKVTMKIRYGTIETTDGRVLRLDTRIQSALSEIRTFGDVINDQMMLTLETGGQRTQVPLAWGPEVRGPYAAELSLSREPMKPGDARDVRFFVPALNVIGTLRLNAREVEDVELGGGARRELLRVDSAVTLPDGKAPAELKTTYWVDTGGQILKSFTDVYGGLVTYRTTKEAATSKADAGRFDLIASSVLKIRQQIPDPLTQKRVVYRLGVADVDPATLFPNDRRQTLTPSPEGKTATLEVATAGPQAGDAGPEAVDPQYLRPNPLINSDDALVQRSLRDATKAAAADPWSKAVAINAWVARNVDDKNFKTAFASASEVARMRSGDCTEHSVLAAAMYRAAGIPARVAVGLVYAENLGGFGFHMWNEVYVNRRWVALDASFDQTEVDATHLKLADSSLDGVSPFEPFLSVAQVFSKLSLEVVELR